MTPMPWRSWILQCHGLVDSTNPSTRPSDELWRGWKRGDHAMTKEYRLSVDPRILELLGPSLYTNIYYVLAELIANAYDADAHNVYIIAKKDEIRVEDDGHGMSYDAGMSNAS